MIKKRTIHYHLLMNITTSSELYTFGETLENNMSMKTDKKKFTVFSVYNV